jgi:DNA (cytosine-5)-methyltransferase 1
MTGLSCVEICAGAGGQALGLEQAGFAHAAAVEIDPAACATLRANRPGWKVHEGDVRYFTGRPYAGADLVAGGVPCPPFSLAGQQLGEADERNLFPEALRLVAEIQPRAVLLENVPGLGQAKFAVYRGAIRHFLREYGYEVFSATVQAADYGVPQLRPRFVFVAIQPRWAAGFAWPAPAVAVPVTVGDALHDLMAAGGWPGADGWRAGAQQIAPTLVGGSRKHGGPDLGPTRAKRHWREHLGVDAMGVADAPPGPGFPVGGLPRLTVRMAARIQGFPDEWQITGAKTAAYRQVGNAFPPPVAAALGDAIRQALVGARPPRDQDPPGTLF